MTQTLLEIRDLKTYAEYNGRFLRIVDGISFDIRKGEIVALFGECGCGKTTTAYSIMGGIKYMPGVIEGKIYLEGENLLESLSTICSLENKDGRLEIKKDVRRWNKVYRERMREVRGKRLFLVMQGAKSNLNPYWKVRKQVEAISGLNHVADVFESMHLKNKMSHYPHQLSGGECQRVLLAMAFVSQAELLIIDEPTVGIDVLLKEEITQLLKKYCDNVDKQSILLISHDLDLIKEIADRIVVMCSGKIVEAGNKDSIINTPKHPYTKMLIESFNIPKEANNLLTVIKGSTPLLDREYTECRFFSRCEKKDESVCSFQQPNIIDTGDAHFVRCFKG